MAAAAITSAAAAAINKMQESRSIVASIEVICFMEAMCNLMAFLAVKQRMPSKQRMLSQGFPMAGCALPLCGARARKVHTMGLHSATHSIR